MSILICSKRYGGCGHIGAGIEWKRMEHPFLRDCILCPICKEDHAFSLDDSNFDDLVSMSDREAARIILNKSNAGVHGDFLRSCVKRRVILIANLTKNQQEELGIWP